MATASRPYLRYALLTVLALLLALVAVGTVLARQKAANAARPSESVRAVFALHDLLPGVAIAHQDVAARELHPDSVPQGAAFSSAEDVVGRVPRERILGNELVRAERLARPDLSAGLSAIIQPGQRAVTVPLGAGVLARGQLATGNLVDLQLVRRGVDERGRVTRTEGCVVEAARVLLIEGAVVQPGETPETSPTEGSVRGITVEVSPEEGAVLAGAVMDGVVYPLQRSEIDVGGGPGVPCVPRRDGSGDR